MSDAERKLQTIERRALKHIAAVLLLRVGFEMYERMAATAHQEVLAVMQQMSPVVIRRNPTVIELVELCSEYDLDDLCDCDLAAFNAIAAYVGANSTLIEEVAADHSLEPTPERREEILDELRLKAQGLVTADDVMDVMPGQSLTERLARLLRRSPSAERDFGTFLRSASRHVARAELPVWPTAVSDIQQMSVDPNLHEFVSRAAPSLALERGGRLPGKELVRCTPAVNAWSR